MKKKINWIVAITIVLLGLLANSGLAQGLKPRRLTTPAAPVTPPPAKVEAPKVAEPKAEPKPAAVGTLTLKGELPAKLEAHRRHTAKFKAEGGVAPYNWSFSGPSNGEVTLPYKFYPTDKNTRQDVEFAWHAQRQEGRGKTKITVEDSSKPPLSMTKEFDVTFTPMDVKPKDIYDMMPTASSVNDLTWRVNRWTANLQSERNNAYSYADGRIKAERAVVQSYINDLRQEAEARVRSLFFYGTLFVLALVASIVGFISWRLNKTHQQVGRWLSDLHTNLHQAIENSPGRTDDPKGERPMDRTRRITPVVLLLAIALSSKAFAQTVPPIPPTPPAAPTAKTIASPALTTTFTVKHSKETALLPRNAVVQGQDPVEVTFASRNLGDSAKVDCGAGVSATDVKASAKQISLKLQAEDSAQTGSRTCEVKRADDSVVTSASIKVMGLSEAEMYLDLKGQIAKVSGQVAASEKKLSAAIKTAVDDATRGLNAAANRLEKVENQVSTVENTASAALATALQAGAGVEAINLDVVSLKSSLAVVAEHVADEDSRNQGGFLGIGRKPRNPDRARTAREIADMYRAQTKVAANSDEGAVKKEEKEK